MHWLMQMLMLRQKMRICQDYLFEEPFSFLLRWLFFLQHPLMVPSLPLLKVFLILESFLTENLGAVTPTLTLTHVGAAIEAAEAQVRTVHIWLTHTPAVGHLPSTLGH